MSLNNPLKAKLIKDARAKDKCVQCFVNPRQHNSERCLRCLDQDNYNRKHKVKFPTDPVIRNKINTFCRKEGICTGCFGRPVADKDHRQCKACLIRKKAYKASHAGFEQIRNRRYYADNVEKKRSYQAQWRKDNRDKVYKSKVKYEKKKKRIYRGLLQIDKAVQMYERSKNK